MEGIRPRREPLGAIREPAPQWWGAGAADRGRLRSKHACPIHRATPSFFAVKPAAAYGLHRSTPPAPAPTMLALRTAAPRPPDGVRGRHLERLLRASTQQVLRTFTAKKREVEISDRTRGNRMNTTEQVTEHASDAEVIANAAASWAENLSHTIDSMSEDDEDRITDATERDQIQMALGRFLDQREGSA